MTQSVLFICNQNAVRSPMAAALARARLPVSARIDSAGVYEGELDPFSPSVLEEIGVGLHDHQPKLLNEIALDDFDRAIALTPEAAIALRRLAPQATIEFWDVANPSAVHGGRDAILDAYRETRDALRDRIRIRFPNAGTFRQTL